MYVIMKLLDKILEETEQDKPSWLAIRSYVQEIKRLIKDKGIQ